LGQPIEVKILADDGDSLTVAGYGVVFGGRDLQGDTFTRDTDLWLDKLSANPPVLFDHGQDDSLKRSVVGRVTSTRLDDVGVWITAKLTANKRYLDAIRELVEKGVLGWSSGAVGHLVERAKGGKLLSWAIAEFSLTPTPAEPRTLGVQMVKALAEFDPDLGRALDLTDGVTAPIASANGRGARFGVGFENIESKPYRISKRGGEYCVIGPGGRSHGCHSSRSGAIRQQRALYANEGKAMDESELPDSAFAYIDAGGALDTEQKTVPRSNRHLPHHNDDGSVDQEAIIAFLEEGDTKSVAVAHMMQHAMADLLGMELDGEVKGASAAGLAVAFQVLLLTARQSHDVKAMKRLEYDVHDGWRMYPGTLKAWRDLAAEVTKIVTKAEEIERGVDGAASVQTWRTAFELLDLEEVA
jgi:hypothetical protein